MTRQDKTAPKFPDLIRRDFTASAANTKWVGDITEIPTAAGKLYFATVIDLYSRRLLGAATSRHPDADLACAAIEMAIAVRGGRQAIAGVVFHTDSKTVACLGAPGFRDSHADRPWGLPWCRRCSRSI
ncbi:DDE-type integrase/transposase/recombinase, partial [Nostocoides vanveenii]|uniref:DDE-type integrase/transposase/recombinase n=1 Tax=Nostocoides vanveenii TaxID=330835 RepID=UPI0031CF2758